MHCNDGNYTNFNNSAEFELHRINKELLPEIAKSPFF